MKTLRTLLLGAATLLVGIDCNADVGHYIDKQDWIAVVGPFETAGFTGFPHGTFITDQYADIGVIFTDGNDSVVCCSEEAFPEDGAGLEGNLDITLAFDTPMRWIAADFPGGLQYLLFYENELIFTSNRFSDGGVGFFFGLTSSRPFDSAVVICPTFAEAEIDDLHFGGAPWGDIDLNGAVDAADLLTLLGAWGPCPEPVDPCPGDIDDDDEVDATDLVELLGAWGKNPGHPADVDGDGVVGTADLVIVLGNWGDCPPPPVILCPPTSIATTPSAPAIW